MFILFPLFSFLLCKKKTEQCAHCLRGTVHAGCARARPAGDASLGPCGSVPFIYSSMFSPTLPSL